MWENVEDAGAIIIFKMVVGATNHQHDQNDLSNGPSQASHPVRHVLHSDKRIGQQARPVGVLSQASRPGVYMKEYEALGEESS